MKKSTLNKTLTVIKYLLIYYLAAKMICFAIPKFFFMQFRVLNWQSYMPLVEISKYEHMWSFFGRSYRYNLFIGITEFLIGALVVFKRTRLIALLLSIGVCTNILILNIEFDIHFAIQHVLLDLAITVLLLSGYFKDLYKFFIKLGGKLDSKGFNGRRNRMKTILPLLFVVILSISYSIYAYSIKSTVNEDLVGAYEVKNFLFDDREEKLTPGKLGNYPMIFLEYNNQVVLSANDSLYFGYYYSNGDKINFRFKTPAVSDIKVVEGSKTKNSFAGIANDTIPFELTIQRIDKEENYLNGLYR